MMQTPTLGQTSRPAADAANGYFRQSQLPLASLLFVLPLLLVYEGGVWMMGPHAPRNGADVCLRGWLAVAGLGHYLLLPLLTIGLLLACQHATGRRWRVSHTVLFGMTAESVLAALVMYTLAQAQGAVLQSMTGAGGWVVACQTGAAGSLVPLVAFAGAGIYEETLFRLLLLPLAASGFSWLGASRRSSRVWAVAISSILFAWAHHLGPQGESFALYPFCFRSIAGALFAVLYLHRGFGVAAGAHAGYDLLVVWNA